MVKAKSAKGKSKKITWKKIQHPDVDDFLEEARRDERLGLSEKPDSQLFFVDQLGFDDDYAQLAQKRKEAALKRHTRAKDGPLVDLGELNCFKILKSTSAVKDPVIKRNAVKKGGGKKTPDMKLKEELRYFRQTAARQQRKTDNQGEAPVTKDLWADDGKTADKIVQDNEWLTGETKRNILRRTTHTPSRKVNEISAVEVPHPGLSYNPSFLHHQQLLSKALENEKLRLKKAAQVNRATHTPKIVGDGTLPEVKSEDEEEQDDDKSTVRKLAKPKTKQQKRKAKEQRDKDVKHKQEKVKAKKESEVFRVKSLRKEIAVKEKQNKARLAKKVELKLTREKFGTKELGRFAFEEKEVQPLLSDELPKGLGTSVANSTADLLVDRFKSLQKRNIVEPRIKQKQKRKYKPKIYQRDCDKMEWEKTGMWNGEKLLTNSGRRRPQQRKTKRGKK